MAVRETGNLVLLNFDKKFKLKNNKIHSKLDVSEIISQFDGGFFRRLLATTLTQIPVMHCTYFRTYRLFDILELLTNQGLLSTGFLLCMSTIWYNLLSSHQKTLRRGRHAPNQLVSSVAPQMRGDSRVRRPLWGTEGKECNPLQGLFREIFCSFFFFFFFLTMRITECKSGLV